MKKRFSVLFAALLVFAVIGQASAAFDANDLVQSVYDRANNTEVGLNLGDLLDTNELGNLSSLSNEVVVDNFHLLSNFAAGTDYADLKMGVFGASDLWLNTLYNNLYFATSSTTAPVINPDWNYGGTWGTTFVDNVRATYRGPGSDQVVIGPTIGTDYDEVMNQNVSSGSYAGYNSDVAHGEVSLADLETVGYVDMYLYHVAFNETTFEYELQGANGNDHAAVIRLAVDGTNGIDTIVNPVPVPGAILLFASGLVGLLGIRRRNA